MSTSMMIAAFETCNLSKGGRTVSELEAGNA